MRNFVLKHWYLGIIIGCGAVSSTAWLLVLFFISTDDFYGAGVILFLGSLVLALFSWLLLLFYHLRIKVLKLSPPFRQFHSVFRESAIVALAILTSLIFSHIGYASAINIAILIAFCLLIDLFFIFNYDTRSRQKTA